MNHAHPRRRIGKLLVANRGEIAIRVMRAATELGIRTVAIYTHEDRFSLHRFKADESYEIGLPGRPIAAYLDIQGILAVARSVGVDAIHPGYGFLSENPDFAEACEATGIVFVGPGHQILRAFGDKVSARRVAAAAGVPVLPASVELPSDPAACRQLVTRVGYPAMLKAAWGGGGRGMRIIESEDQIDAQLQSARREAGNAFGNDAVYVEKLVRRARHVEIQILGDLHGGLIHLYERDCSVQRRHQKVVERAPAPYLTDTQRERLCQAALALGRQVAYTHAGTVEFLLDDDSGEFYFIEVNPRIQVEHTVTEEVTGIDLVKAQIRVAEGARIGEPSGGLPSQADVRLSGHALQCRVTTEDPSNGFTPDHGRLIAYRSPAGFGIRLDGGTAYSGALITPYYDSLLVKVTARGRDVQEAIARMDRALREFRIRGLATNLPFLENVIGHPAFASGSCTTRFIDETPELFEFTPRRDRATRLLRFLGEVTVNGNPQMKGRQRPQPCPPPRLPALDLSRPPPSGLRDILKADGAQGLADWLRNQDKVLVTDTAMRDAHQSLFATRMRSYDLLAIAPYYARLLPGLFSIECWGGATFDVALRFLKEDPWERLARLREAIPNIPLQMLLRSANAVGYTNYADNVVRQFVHRAAATGIDVFRIFDCLNLVDNMMLAIGAVREAGGVAEAAICYSGDLLDRARPKYDLRYYVELAKKLERGGAQILGIKDMAGLCRPQAAKMLVTALKQETGLPIHFHTHDTSGISAASVLAAVEAGVDAVDTASDALSGLTSQPNLGSICAALAGGRRDPNADGGLDAAALQEISTYWEGVRRQYAPFEADIRSGTADVYKHEMPGGQYSNLREQARALGLEARWPEISQAYADVNRAFGDIVKVTPTSKVVGDMALHMVANNLTVEELLDPERPVDFPESVVSLFRGDLGTPPEGWPEGLQRKVLGERKPIAGRPGASIPPVDLEAARTEAEKRTGLRIGDNDLMSYLMYPKVFGDYAEHLTRYGDVGMLPTPAFFYGLDEASSEMAVDIEPGKRLIIRLQSRTDLENEGFSRLFFELNGQPRTMRIPLAGSAQAAARPVAAAGDPNQIGAPMPGMVVRVAVRAGQAVEKGEPLLALEAMKMETVVAAPRAAKVQSVHVAAGDPVQVRQLLLELGD